MPSLEVISESHQADFLQRQGGEQEPGDGRFCIHYVGGRNGDGTFPVLEKFERDFIKVFYDADGDCSDHILENSKHLGSQVYAYPYCLGAETKSADFNLNYDPNTSSLLELNPDYKDFYMRRTAYDYVFSEAAQTVEKRRINLVTLDELVDQGKVVPPDFLSIDTQGSEYDVLLGAKNTIQKGVLGLILEAEFVPIYKDQKLFGDLSQFLFSQGFYFVKFVEIEQASPCRAHPELRAEGFQLYGDALFLRRIDNIENSAISPPQRRLMLRKLAFLSIVFNQFEYGLQCLHSSKRLEPSSELNRLSYEKFLTEIETATKKFSFPSDRATLSSIMTHQYLKGRYEIQAGNAGPSQRPTLKALSQRLFPSLFSNLRRLKYQTQEFYFRLHDAIGRVFAAPSKVESILDRWGFSNLAGLLREERLKLSSIRSHYGPRLT